MNEIEFLVPILGAVGIIVAGLIFRKIMQQSGGEGEVADIAQQKKQLETRLATGEVEKELAILVGKRKELLAEQLNSHFQEMRRALSDREEAAR